MAKVRVRPDTGALYLDFFYKSVRCREQTALADTISVADSAAEEDLSQLTAVYENMKPADAAALFETMEPDFSAGFVGRMRPEVAAAIMALLAPETAYAISAILAGRNANAPTQ